MKNSKKKPDRWEYLNELDGRPTDTTPVRSLYRRPDGWEWVLYGLTALLWVAALVLAVMGRYGSVSLLVMSLCVLGLRLTVFEAKRRKRCKGALLGTVEGFTRRRHIRKNAKYPVIRFEVDSTVYTVHSATPAHPSTQGNEEWVRYNTPDPADSFAAKDSKPRLALGLTVLTAFLGVVLLILELN